MSDGLNFASDSSPRSPEGLATPPTPLELVNADDIVRLSRRGSDDDQPEEGRLVDDGDQLGYAIGRREWETCIRVGWSRMHQQWERLNGEDEVIECVVKAAHAHAALIADRAISTRHLLDAQRQLSSPETEGALQHWKSEAVLLGARVRRIEADLLRATRPL